MCEWHYTVGVRAIHLLYEAVPLQLQKREESMAIEKYY
jgi:hypothetical protein